MSNNYTLEIISHHSQFDGKSLRKYYVDGIDTVGVWGDEPFEIRFKNNTWQKVQVKLSVDGTDIFTGKPADTNPSSDMWVVQPYGTLSLKAWPENNNGGAAFVFTSANNSVAIHTHGDLSSRGIIAAAVFVEGEPARLTYTYPYTTIIGGGYTFGGGYNSGVLGGSIITNNCNTWNASNSIVGNTASLDSFTLCDTTPASASCSVDGSESSARREMKSLESLVAVGAGQHVDQQITYVEGLAKPVFTETVRVRYMWYDDMVVSLKHNNVPASHASGFPGDRNQNHINLGNTPRLPTHGSFSRGGCFRPAYEPVYTRF